MGDFVLYKQSSKPIHPPTQETEPAEAGFVLGGEVETGAVLDIYPLGV